MAEAKTRSTPSANGSAASRTVAKAREAGDSVATAARKSKRPALAAGATAAGLAGGLALGSRMTAKRHGLGAILTPRRKVLGVPVGRRKSVVRTAEALGQVARELRSMKQGALSEDDVKEVREQLEMANRRSPIEVVVDALTHRRGAHKRES